MPPITERDFWMQQVPPITDIDFCTDSEKLRFFRQEYPKREAEALAACKVADLRTDERDRWRLLCAVGVLAGFAAGAFLGLALMWRWA